MDSREQELDELSASLGKSLFAGLLRRVGESLQLVVIGYLGEEIVLHDMVRIQLVWGGVMPDDVDFVVQGVEEMQLCQGYDLVTEDLLSFVTIYID